MEVNGQRVSRETAFSVRKLGLKAKEEVVDFVDFTKRTLGNQVGAVGDIGKLVDAAQGTSRGIITLNKQLQKKFIKHAKDFGIVGNESKVTLKAFSEAIETHVKSNSTEIIEGSYRNTQKVVHYLDKSTGLNVMKDYNGKLISGWKLSPDQLKNLLERGNIQ